MDKQREFPGSLPDVTWVALRKAAEHVRRFLRQLAQPAGLLDEQFEAIREFQKSWRGVLSRVAYCLPSSREGNHYAKLGIPLLFGERWLPTKPVRLAPPDQEFHCDESGLDTRFERQVPTQAELERKHALDERASYILPVRPAGSPRPERLQDAIRRIEKPPSDRFQSLPSYALREIRVENGRKPRLTFGLAGYLDYVDVGELLAYELALAAIRDETWLEIPSEEPGSEDRLAFSRTLERREGLLPLRRLAGPWSELGLRPSIAGVSCLLLIRDAGLMRFIMMHRGKRRNQDDAGQYVAAAQNTFHVIPAGEFQPTRDEPGEPEKQCTLWQTIFREFAEEILSIPEAKYGRMYMQDLVRTRPLPQLQHLTASGKAVAWFLGCGIDPLTWKVELMVALGMERRDLADLLADAGNASDGEEVRLPEFNHEGMLLRDQTGWGYSFDEAAVARWADDPRTLPAGVGCLRLALKHRDQLIRSWPA